MKRFLRKRSKTGASLLVVIVAVTLLIVMGSTFSIVAMNAYNNSHRRLCQQQAYYTAEACLNILSTQFASDPTGKYMYQIRDKIKKEYVEDRDKAEPGNPLYVPSHKRRYKNISDVIVTIANLKDKDGNDGVTKIPSNGIEASLLNIVGGCLITASAVEGTKNVDSISQIRLKSTGIYKGYSQTVSARMATTTNGALELKKIFSNSQTWDTPIVTLIAGQTTGDMYFSSPGKYERWPNGEIRLDNAYYDPAKHITYKDYNEGIRDIYGNVASGKVGNNSTNPNEYVHTRPFGIDNKPLKLPSMRCIPIDVINDEEAKLYKYDVSGKSEKKSQEARENIRKENDAKLKKLVEQYYYVGAPTNDTQYYNFYLKESDRNIMLGPNAEHPIFRTQMYWNNVSGYHDRAIDNYYLTYDKPTNFTTAYGSDMWYNDWVEIYMFTGQHGAGQNNIVNGDMYVNTQALIGLYDKDATQVSYWPYRDTISHRDKVERKYVSYRSPENTTELYFEDDFPFYRDLYRNGYNMGKNFEHGGVPGEDLFFDYYGAPNEPKPPKYNQSVLSHNGNMYLFEDARIECYDSTHSPNATKGVKNNIFAHKNLVIDGVAMKQGMTELRGTGRDYSKSGPDVINYRINNLYTERNVSIYGDVMVEGDLMISNATIYGDVFVNGDNLYIADSEIYGNVYFNGGHMVADNADIRGDEKTMKVKPDGTLDKDSQGTLVDGQGKLIEKNPSDPDNTKPQHKSPFADKQTFSFQTDEGRCIKLNGGDLVVLGRTLDPSKPKDKAKMYDNAVENTKNSGFFPEEERFQKERNDKDMWGVRLTNCTVSGTLFSEINTCINTMFRTVDDYRDADGVLHDMYDETLGNYKTADPADFSKAEAGYNIWGNIIDGDYIEDRYNNIIVSANLLFDLREKYRHDQSFADQTYLATLMNNALRINGVCMAERMQIVMTQSGDGPKNTFGTDADSSNAGKPNFTRYEKQYISDVDNQLTNDTKIWRGAKDVTDKHNSYVPDDTVDNPHWALYPYLPHFVVDRRTKDINSRHYRCSAIYINTVCAGDGGIYIDGTPRYFEIGNKLKGLYENDYWYAQYQSDRMKHSAININRILTTTELTGDLDGGTGASKIALYNIAGQAKNSTEFNYCNLYTAINHDYKFRGTWQAPVAFPTKFETVDNQVVGDDVTLANIKKHMYREIVDLIEKDEAGKIEVTNETKSSSRAASRPSKDNPPATVDGIIGVLRDYYMLDKAPRRINSYYKYMSDSMNYRGYKELGDIREWADSVEGAGPYQRYEEGARDGVWRQITVLQWKAPTSVTAKEINNTNAVDAMETAVFDKGRSGGDFAKDSFNVNLLPKIAGYIEEDNGVTVIKGNINTDRALYVPKDKKLIFDTTNGNIHCQITGGLILDDGAQVVIRGGGMTFLYMHNTTTNLNTINSMENIIMYMGKGARLGVVEGSQDSASTNDSIYVICNDNVSLIQMKTMASVNGYVYSPNGYLQIDEFDWVKGKRSFYTNATQNTVVRGSMIVKSFLIDMSIDYSETFNMYKNLKYEYIMAPLICDTNINVEDPGAPPSENDFYNTDNWGFIGFD